MEVINIKNCDTLVIKKRPDSKYYHCSFYSGKSTTNKSGMTRVSLRTANQKEAIKLAKELWKNTPRVEIQDRPVQQNHHYNA